MQCLPSLAAAPASAGGCPRDPIPPGEPQPPRCHLHSVTPFARLRTSFVRHSALLRMRLSSDRPLCTTDKRNHGFMPLAMPICSVARAPSARLYAVCTAICMALCHAHGFMPFARHYVFCTALCRLHSDLQGFVPFARRYAICTALCRLHGFLPFAHRAARLCAVWTDLCRLSNAIRQKFWRSAFKPDRHKLDAVRGIVPFARL